MARDGVCYFVEFVESDFVLLVIEVKAVYGANNDSQSSRMYGLRW